jgi:hypothetical protein
VLHAALVEPIRARIEVIAEDCLVQQVAVIDLRTKSLQFGFGRLEAVALQPAVVVPVAKPAIIAATAERRGAGQAQNHKASLEESVHY